MYLSKYASEVMRHLTPTIWKTRLELVDEVWEQRIKEGKVSISYRLVAHFSPVLAKILFWNYQEVSSGLDQLEKHELVEWRWRDDPPEQLAKRGGNRRSEWKLTEKGHRSRASILQGKAATEDASGVFAPKPT